MHLLNRVVIEKNRKYDYLAIYRDWLDININPISL